MRASILSTAATYYHDALDDHPEVLGWLKRERGLTLTTISEHQLGWADGRLREHLESKGFKLSDIIPTGLVTKEGRDFLHDHITIPYHVAGNVVMIRGKEIGGKYLTPSGQKTRLFNSDKIWNANEVIACEGEFDAMVIEQFGYQAIGVPGANTWQDSWDSYFADTYRLYLFFDPDEAGRRGATKVHEKLSPRARIVEVPVPDGVDPAVVDPTYLLLHQGLTRERIQELLSKASGGLLKSPHDAYVAYHEGLKLGPGLKFGIEELDLVINPGLRPTQVMMILARSGVGKTIILLNLFQAMIQENPDVRILFVSLEQTAEDWWERVQRIHRFHNLDATDDDVWKAWMPALRIVDRNRVNEETLVAILKEYEYEMGCKPDLVAIDYLGYWAQAFKGEPYVKTSDAMMSLKAIAKEHQVAILAPHQVNRGAEPGCEPSPDDARNSGAVLEQADFLFTMWNPDDKLGTLVDQKQYEIHLRLSKSRHGNAGVLLRYQFAPITLSMVPIGHPLQPFALWEAEQRKSEDMQRENHLTPVPMTWQEVIIKHGETDSMYGSGGNYYE